MGNVTMNQSFRCALPLPRCDVVVSFATRYRLSTKKSCLVVGERGDDDSPPLHLGTFSIGSKAHLSKAAATTRADAAAPDRRTMLLGHNAVDGMCAVSP